MLNELSFINIQAEISQLWAVEQCIRAAIIMALEMDSLQLASEAPRKETVMYVRQCT